MNIQHPEQKDWLQARMEPTENSWPLDDATKRRSLARVIEAEEFEQFLHARFVGHKRFSSEGGEAALAILDEVLERAANTNVHEAVIGMAHRGRLTVLANIVGKTHGADLLGVRGRHRSEFDAGLGRRQVPPRRERSPDVATGQ